MLTILLGVFGISNIIGNRVSGLISEGPGLRAMPFVYISQLILMALMPLVFHYSWLGAVLLFLVIFTMPLINSPIQLFSCRLLKRNIHSQSFWHHHLTRFFQILELHWDRQLVGSS